MRRCCLHKTLKGGKSPKCREKFALKDDEKLGITAKYAANIRKSLPPFD
jgi:hypothetical protein